MFQDFNGDMNMTGLSEKEIARAYSVLIGNSNTKEFVKRLKQKLIQLQKPKNTWHKDRVNIEKDFRKFINW